jgi:putative NADH-flavin reductase
VRVLIVGATGRTGGLLVEELRASGHEVTALARDPARLAGRPVRALRGDVRDAASVADAVRGQDAVIVSLAPTGRALLARRQTLFSEGGRNVLSAMKVQRVARLLFVTSAGLDREDPAHPFLFRYLFEPLLLRPSYADAAKLESEVRASDLDWTLVRPPALTDGPRTASYRLAEPRLPPGGRELSRADLAHFLASELAARRWIRRTVAIAS